MTKRIKGKIFVRKKNKNKKKTLKNKPKSEKYIEKDAESLEEEGDSRVHYSKYQVVFLYTNSSADTLIISHSSYHNDILEGGKSEITHLIKKTGSQNILKVMITPVRLDQQSILEDLSVKKRRKKKIQKFLRENGVPSQRIVFISE